MSVIPALALFAASAAAPAAMQLGVNTHFDQGWPLVVFDQVRETGAQGIRDGLGWGKIEQARGQYVFTAENSGFAQQACDQGLSLMLTLTPRNKLYDQGETVYSPQGRKAFAAYARAVADRFPCLAAVEIGNEINDHSLKGRMKEQMPGSYIAILAETRSALQGQRNRVALLSGSTLSLAPGFFDGLFQAGLLPLVDGIVVHPYLAAPEQWPAQFDRLNAAMDRAGMRKPVWASEFSFAYASPDDAPPHALKIITLMSAADVHRADWYALREEAWFPNAGVFAGARQRPVLDSLRLAVSRLLPAGDARRIATGDPLLFGYRFGDGPYVLWGADRPIRWNGSAHAWDARGRPIALPDRIGDEPVVVESADGFALGEPVVLADSLLDFAGQGWSYTVIPTKGAPDPLDWIDWNWASYLGSERYSAFRALPGGIALGGRPKAPIQLVERFSGKAAGAGWVSACFEGRDDRPQRVTILAQDKVLFSTVVTGEVRTALVPVPASQPLAFEVRYEGVTAGGPQFLHRRIRLLTQPQDRPALCPPRTTREQRQ
jgi:hypothetical protein